MDRRDFIGNLSAGSLILGAPAFGYSTAFSDQESSIANLGTEARTDVVIAGGGLGGVAAALGCLRNGLSVILTEETEWIGGQISQQGVPPDEHKWIETHGAPESYRGYRRRVRDFYRRNYPLTPEAKAKEDLNPGDGSVSRICHEPRVALAVMLEMLAPYMSTGKLILLPQHKVVAAEVEGDSVKSVNIRDLRDDNEKFISASYFIDATELGDLLPLTGTEYVTGAESKAETNELHAAEKADPANNQAFTVCFAIDYVPSENHVIPKPREYDFWQSFTPKMDHPWPGKLLELSYTHPSTLKPKTLGFHPEGVRTGDALNLWVYRRLINPGNFLPGTYAGGATIVNWPQNDYFLGNIVDVSEGEIKKHVNRGKQLSLSLLYWLQTEVPRPDGGTGWPGLRLRKDIMGTEDGLAKYPYIRESRRIKAQFTILEEHVGAENRIMVAGKKKGSKAARFEDSVGIGYYHIDLHPSSGGNNYIDFGSLPFQIPLGALLPVRMKNILPANKNIGTTHITNGCYRLHPVEWSIGEAVGMLCAFAMNKKVTPEAVRADAVLLADFQRFIQSQGVELEWPEG